MSVSFYRGENPLHADKLNQAFSERVSRYGDTMNGLLTLSGDPVGPFDAVTKQYVDYRFSNIIIPPSGVTSFNGRNGDVIQISADITGALGYTPYDAANPAGYTTAAQAASAAPVQSVAARTGAIVLTHLDITDWNATLGPYALTANVPVASSTTPTMNGTAAVGTGTTWARSDHVHPTDTSRYAASNPSGYQTAAQVTSALGPYALTSSVPVASSVLPLIEGTAAIGTSAAYARADHVHPAAAGGASVYIGDTPPP
jgi:hypothetical protein